MPNTIRGAAGFSTRRTTLAPSTSATPKLLVEVDDAVATLTQCGQNEVGPNEACAADNEERGSADGDASFVPCARRQPVPRRKLSASATAADSGPGSRARARLASADRVR